MRSQTGTLTDLESRAKSARWSLRSGIESAFKELLETKHLYQSVVLDADKIVAASFVFPPGTQLAASPTQYRNPLREAAGKRWLCRQSPEGKAAYEQHSAQESLSAQLIFDVPSGLMIFCESCDQRLPFNVTSVVDVLHVPSVQISPASMMTAKQERQMIEAVVAHHAEQAFVITMLCQRCKKIPEVFLVRRPGVYPLKIQLCGRQPMEHIEVPAALPKPEAILFRRALISYNSGFYLAALSYLRAFIEQFARRVTGIADRKTGEEILSAYASKLPEKLRDEMPSLRDWYEQISEPLHSAKEDAAVFEKAKEAVLRHFEIRAAFRIAEEPAAPPGPERM